MSSEEGEKKEPEYIFSEYHPKGSFHDASTDELLKYLQEYHADTTEASAKRRQISIKKENSVKSLDNILDKFLIEKRGEHENHKGTPSSFEVNSSEEAGELLYNLAKESFRQEYGEQALKSSDQDRVLSNLTDKLNRFGLDYHKIKRDLVQRRNVKEVLPAQILEQLAHVKEEHYNNLARNVLIKDFSHHEKVRSHGNEYFLKEGHKFKESVKIEDIVNVLPNIYRQGNKVSGDMLDNYEKMLEPYKPAK